VKDGSRIKNFTTNVRPGMTLLDHFAGLAMQECMRSSDSPGEDESIELIAHGAYRYARAMIKEREEILNDV